MTDVRPRLELKTVAIRPDGCFSAMLWDGRPFAVSLEHVFEDGRPVIGAGVLDCKRSFYEHGGYPTFEIIVAGHSRVLFHKGNKNADSKACVLVAESFAVIDGDAAIADSAHGFEEFMSLAGALDFFRMTVTGR